MAKAKNAHESDTHNHIAAHVNEYAIYWRKATDSSYVVIQRER